MANGAASPGSGPSVGASDPITLSDPDGAITRVAPWSTWTREQVRAPGGEPSLVTHLQDGQLWFAAGRTRSPWNHEIRIGDTSVSTPRGRFHVATTNGMGATVACLSGRTRIVVGDEEPVIIRENQTAAIGSDGDTIVVTDEEAVVESDAEPLAGLDADEPPTDDALLPVPVPRRVQRFAGLARVAALVAIVAVAFAAIAVLLRDRGGDDQVAAPPTTEVGATGPAPTEAPATTDAPATTEAPTTTEATTTTAERATTTVAVTEPQPTEPVAPPVTVATVRSSPDAVAVGVLEACRRDDGSVIATVDVKHRSGGPGRFRVEIGLIDRSGRPIASGRSDTGLLAPGTAAPVEVTVPVEGAVRGVCELVGVSVV